MNALANNETTIWNRSFIMLSLSNALLFAGFHLLLPTLPLFAAAYGATSTEIGLIIGGFTFSAIGIRLFASAGISRWGRSGFLRAGVIICILSMSSYYFTSHAATTLLVRLAHGLGFGIASTVYAALAVDLIPPARRGEGMGYFSLGAIFMMALAPLTGLWLYEVFQAEGLFLAGAVMQSLALVSLFFISFNDDETALPPKNSQPSPFSIRQILLPCFLSLLMGTCMGGVMSFITLLAQERHFSNPGLFFLVSTSCIFLVRTFSGRVYDRLGAHWVIAPAALSLFLSMVLLFTGKASIPTAAVFYGAGIGALFPALQTWAIQLAPRGKQAAASATFYNSLDIGVGGGSVLLGYIAEGQSYAAIYLVTSCMSFIFLISYLVHLWRRQAPKECSA